ncbi:MAG: hypothetical protein IJV01_06045 [Bacteroidales bacterium]|nr:hypothetical protein [Bacteroidales bacterium]
MKRLFLLWLLALACLSCGPQRAVVHTVFERNSLEAPLYSGHRGLQPFGPENTFASFEACAPHGLWAVETDFRRTADGVVVCMHDASLDRTTNGSGLVREHSWKEIKALEVKEVNGRTVQKCYDYATLSRRQKGVPTMDDYFRICSRGGLVAFVELKEDDGVIAQMNRCIERYKMQGRCVISSSKRELLAAYRAQGGRELIHLIFAKIEDLDWLVSLGNAALAFNYPDLSAEVHLQHGEVRIDSLKELVDHCHALGLKICFRAVDTPEAAAQSAALGLDYFPTNNLWPGRYGRSSLEGVQ